MKAFVTFTTLQQPSTEKMRDANVLYLRGTDRQPESPRDVRSQSGARKVLLTWNLPISHEDITGWRIYKDTEKNLAMEIRDKGTRQMFMDVTSGDVPPVINFFVSAINALGVESAKVQVQGSATAEPGAPSDPAPPPEYTGTGSGGGNKDLRGRMGYSGL